MIRVTVRQGSTIIRRLDSTGLVGPAPGQERTMQKEWTSRQRVETALAFKEADRVPVDLPITLFAYQRLREYLGLPREDNIKANSFYEVQPSPDILEALGIDMVSIKLGKPVHATAPPPLPDGTEFDAWGVGRKKISLPHGGYLKEVTYSPLAGLDPDEIDLDTYPWPYPDDPGYTAGLEMETGHLNKETGLALMGRFGGTVMETGFYMRGFQQWLVDLVLNPQYSREFLERIADIQIALDEAGIRAAGRYLTVFKVSGEDLGMQDRPLFSMKTWREVILPVLERRWKAARRALDRHGASHVKIMLHSDGAIRPFIPDLIAAGIDILDPIQSICPGMEMEGLKRDFGDRLAFHGGVDTQSVMPFGSEAEVEEETRRVINTLGRSGGLILASCHFLQADVPPENIVAMYRAAGSFAD